MQTQILNYRIIIEPEKQGRKTVYNAYCPTLGVTDYGDSVDEVLKSITDGYGMLKNSANILNLQKVMREQG